MKVRVFFLAALLLIPACGGGGGGGGGGAMQGPSSGGGSASSPSAGGGDKVNQVNAVPSQDANGGSMTESAGNTTGSGNPGGNSPNRVDRHSEAHPVPAPATLGLLVAGLVLLAFIRKQ